MHGDPVESASPLDLRSASLHQSTWRIGLELATEGAWKAEDLRPWRPGQPPRPHLCLVLHQRKREPVLCLVPDEDGGTALARAAGHGRWKRLPSARLERAGDRALAGTFGWKQVGLVPGGLRWRLDSDWLADGCASPLESCRDYLPNGGPARARLREPMPAGCSVQGPSVRHHGSRRRAGVGLSFDDGPSTYTPAILRILRRFKVHATFFQIGSQVGGGTRGLERRILRSGSELADHSMRHESLPGYGSIAETKRRIVRASGFRPCLFRPPGGALSGAEVSAARRAGMKTIIWDVDPRDWSTPGTGAIIGNVLGNARRGSIILMHDGGGPRGQTVAALPAILRGLRHRHLRAMTVTGLLNGHVRWH